jgi:hypothetical protein
VRTRFNACAPRWYSLDYTKKNEVDWDAAFELFRNK